MDYQTLKKRREEASIAKVNVPNKDGSFVDRDESGRVIENRNKSSKSVEIEGDSRFCGKRFAVKGKVEGEKRCLYCGKWFMWSQKKIPEYIANDNLDPYNLDNNPEPLHCGSSMCCDYHQKCKESNIKKANAQRETLVDRAVDAVNFLKQMGMM